MKKYQKLLERTLEVQSKSGHERRMKKFVKTYLTGIGLKPKSDNKGNIYCHKGDMRKNRPFVVAHLDTVHSVNKNIKTFFNGEFYYAFDMKEMEQKGVGGDDKVGIWSALAAITQFENISVAFFVEEETGCVGSNAADMKQFDKANWLVQLDRRGFVDFITSSMASPEFINDMEPLALKYGLVNTNQGTITDVSTLFRKRVGVSAVNIASGYFFPHSAREVVRWDDASNALNLTFEMIKKHGTTKYEYAPPPIKKPKKFQKEDSGRTVGFRQKGIKERRTAENAWEGAKYVHGMIRVWNSFYGCFEWRDYSGNLKYYEGVGMKARHFSKRPDNLKSSTTHPPIQEAIPMQVGTKMNPDSAKTYNDHAIQANLNFDEVKDDYVFGLDPEEDQYWADKAEEAAMQAQIAYDEERAFELEMDEKQNKKNKKQKTYHDADMHYAELSTARRQIDAALYLYGYGFQEFLDGLIPDDHIKNISSTLHYDHGNTLAYYERMFGIEGSYDSANVEGCFTDFSKKEDGDLPF